MTNNFLEKLFEHNNWANLQIIQVCSALSDEQLDAAPQSATMGSIRSTLLHLVSAQQGYLRLLTLPLETRRDAVKIAFDELQESVTRSGEGLLALTRDLSNNLPTTQLRTRDDFFVEPWVIMVQIINHATEHREQINSMLSALGVIPPELDGWAYGLVTNTLIPISP